MSWPPPRGINKERADFDRRRRRVIYALTPDMNAEFARVAAEEGFVRHAPGKTVSVPNVSAYFVWLHKQHMKARERAASVR